MAEESFILRYDGSALKEHTIEVSDLGEALLGLSEFIQEGNRIVNAGHAPLSVKVKATEPGCFEVEIVLAQTLYEKAVEIFAGHEASALANLLGILGLGGFGTGVFALVQWLRKRAYTIAEDSEPGNLIIQTSDGDRVIVKAAVWEVARSQKIRASLNRVVKPLERTGVESLKIVGGPKRETLTTIQKADLPAFAPPEEVKEELLTIERETYVRPVNIWLQGDNKWRFSEGEGTFTATMSDPLFAEQMLRDEVSFRTSDVLLVRLRQTQYRVGDNLKSDYKVMEVLEHKEGLTQMSLMLGEKEEAIIGDE